MQIITADGNMEAIAQKGRTYIKLNDLVSWLLRSADENEEPVAGTMRFVAKQLLEL